MTTRPRGRPRKTEVDAAILGAARDLLADDGYERMTMEGIAARAGVGKPTVYRRWPSKAAVVAEAVMAGYVLVHGEPPQDTGDAAADLRRWIREFAALAEDPTRSGVIRGLTAAAAGGDVEADRLYDHITGPSREQLVRRLAAGVEQGQLRADLDVEAAADAISGAFLYRALAPVRADIDGIVDLFLNGMAVNGKG
jgi:AcrR family transcriptional regulator